MHNRSRHERTTGAAAVRTHQPRRPEHWRGLTAQEILDRHPPAKTSPMRVLEILIMLFNHQHTAKQKEVSFKTRQERAYFLRRFFRDLQKKAGFKTLPDPRNLGGRHVAAMVTIWQQERLALATIQTYLSFLRALRNGRRSRGWSGSHRRMACTERNMSGTKRRIGTRAGLRRASTSPA